MLADMLRKAGYDPQEVAHFLIRLLFCLFAEDVGLLPPPAVYPAGAQLPQPARQAFTRQLGQLVRGHGERAAGLACEQILHFDGRLFDDAEALDLGRDGLEILIEVARLDWGNIEPSIFGTLFERSLDPGQALAVGGALHQQGGYSADRRAGADGPAAPQVGGGAGRGAARWRRSATPRAAAKTDQTLQDEAARPADGLRRRDRDDAGAGSGLRERQLPVRGPAPAAGPVERGDRLLAGELGLAGRSIPTVDAPAQLHGIEINEYAHQLAQATIWIGYIQWLRENGYGFPPSRS